MSQSKSTQKSHPTRYIVGWLLRTLVIGPGPLIRTPAVLVLHFFKLGIHHVLASAARLCAGGARSGRSRARSGVRSTPLPCSVSALRDAGSGLRERFRL